MKENRILNSIVLVCIIGFFLAGCAGAGSTKIIMSQEKYAPSFRSGDYSYMRGKKVVFSSFSNQAQNTKAWSYYSADNKYMYEGTATLENYYLHCFQKAFRHIGVSVVDYQYDDRYRDDRHYYRHGYWWGAPGPGNYRAPKGVPEFQFILTSLTDQEFKFKVLLFTNGETKLDKSFTVTMPPAGTDKVADLERRSYRLVDLAFTTIMKDKDFRRVF
jgi:hypothetical protein